MTLTLMLSGFGLLVTRKRFCHFFHRVQQSVAIHKRTQGSESMQYVWALQDYARFLRKIKRSVEAAAIDTHANALRNRMGQKVDVSDFTKH
jgi:hypothetical protein